MFWVGVLLGLALAFGVFLVAALFIFREDR
jgi:hypothetical protein